MRSSQYAAVLVAVAAAVVSPRAAALHSPSTVAQTRTAGPHSPGNANYDLEVRLDHRTRTLTGTGVLRWRNIGRAPTDELFVHLYWNAWRDRESTWMREATLGGRAWSGVRDHEWAAMDVTSLVVQDAAGRDVDGLAALRFVQPDDGNTKDRTLARVALPRHVAPDEEIVVNVGWTARVPRTFARTGAIGSYYFIAHWFPKLAVYEGDRWTARQFHANTEFFSDYGDYDVRITVPQSWTVGATGVELSRRDHPDGTTTHHYRQSDVHDFAWTTSPDFVDARQRFTHPSLPPVAMRLLLQPEHASQADRHFAATAAALRYYGEWFGPYPFPQLTIVDPAYQSGTGGMEYPTLFTAGTDWLAPRQSNTPESVTVHEAGHQFWYGLIGTNEFDHAWMDEGLNTFSEARVLAQAFQPDYLVERFFGGFIPWQHRALALSRASDGNYSWLYRRASERDTPSTPTWRYWPGTHVGISYSKTALWLHTLERWLGWNTLQRILATYFERWRYRHPRPEDFFAVANEVSGQDLMWFFDQVHRGSNVFDYAIEQLTSDNDRTTVVARRHGEAVFPVDVVTTFADGQRVTERWDGRERWRAFTYEGRGRAVSAVVDPERVLLLDVNVTNNSTTLEPSADTAADKWSMVWMLWLQDRLLTWAFFV